MPSASYFATFITGCQEIIAKRLERFGRAQLEVVELHDGLVLFNSNLSENQLSELRFFNNVYRLLADGLSSPIELAQYAAKAGLPKGSTFTARIIKAGKPAPVPSELPERIAKICGITSTAHRPDFEFTLLERADGRNLWGLALPRAGFKTRRLEPGELRPELAHILGLVAGLDTKDVVLDPFAGYGAIVRECLQGFHAREVIAVEHNEHLVPHLKSIPNLIAMHGDAGQLGHLETRGVDRVITDPPWGEFNKQSPDHLRKLYHAAIIQIHRVLRVKGCAVILTSAPFLPEVAHECSFEIEKIYPILVSGRKATIYKIRKRG